MTFKEMTELSSEEQEKLYNRLKNIRSGGKTVNFSATYKVGAKTLARNMKVKEKEAQNILDAYWDRNWSLKAFEKTCKIRTIESQMWVKQPVSGFWYTLRFEKDIFSTVNQGTAVYVFDIWCKHLRDLGISIYGTYHDEIISSSSFKDITQQEFKDKVIESMKRVNEELKLNVEIRCSTDFGRTYLDVH